MKILKAPNSKLKFPAVGTWLNLKIGYFLSINLIMSEQFRITVNELCHINDGKKRKINFDDWQNKKNKMSKDRGEEYVGGRGIVKQAKIPPPQVKSLLFDCIAFFSSLFFFQRSKPVHHDAQSPGVGSLFHDANRFSKNSGGQGVTTVRRTSWQEWLTWSMWTNEPPLMLKAGASTHTLII